VVVLKYEYKPKTRKPGGVGSMGIALLKIRKWLSRKWTFTIALVLLLALAAAFGYYVMAPSLYPIVMPQSSGNPLIIVPALFTSGYTQVKVDADYFQDQGVVTLTSGCKQIVADVEASQAQSIKMGLEGIVGPRPNSHDIVADSFRSYGIEVLMVKIDEVRNDTYFGRIMLRRGNDLETLEARPSDATAIAVRMAAPIYINSTILYEYGDDICSENATR
jgi:bifunctional DNase/RNase